MLRFGSFVLPFVLCFAAACGRLGFEPMLGEAPAEPDASIGGDGDGGDQAFTLPVSADWSELGSSSQGLGLSAVGDGGETRTIELAVGGDDAIFVAWADEREGEYDVHLRHWDGSSWATFGGSEQVGGLTASIDRNARLGSLVVDSNGYPNIAYQSHGGDQRIIFQRWNGTAWEGLGPSMTEGIQVDANNHFPSMALMSGDRPAIVWTDWLNSQVELSWWTGTEWQWQAVPNVIETGLTKVAVDGDDNIYVTWHEDRGLGQTDIYVAMWDGAAWADMGGANDLGGLTNNAAVSQRPKVAIDGQGRPVVAWSDEIGGTSNIMAKRFEAGTWTELSMGGIAMINPLHPYLTIGPQGQPILAWDDDLGGGRDVYVASLGVDAFELVGSTLSASPVRSSYINLALTEQGNLVAIWEEDLSATQAETYLKYISMP
jgi:hypothetical protein